MGNITLWYKDATSDTLGGVAASHKILFDDNTKVLHEEQWNWDNALHQTTNTNPDGTKKVTLTDNGFKGLIIPLTGYILKTATTEVDNLFAFLALQQVTAALLHGRFAIDNPNFPKMTIESGATKGLGIGPGSYIKADHTNGSYSFLLNMYFGGTF